MITQIVLLLLMIGRTTIPGGSQSETVEPPRASEHLPDALVPSRERAPCIEVELAMVDTQSSDESAAIEIRVANCSEINLEILSVVLEWRIGPDRTCYLTPLSEDESKLLPGTSLKLRSKLSRLKFLDADGERLKTTEQRRVRAEVRHGLWSTRGRVCSIDAMNEIRQDCFFYSNTINNRS